MKVDAIKLSDFIKKDLKNRKVDFIKFNIEWTEDSVIHELSESWVLWNIDSMVFEYHHNIEKWLWSRLGQFLLDLEKAWFDYTFSVTNYRLYKKWLVQNLFIHAYKKA